MNAMSFQTPFTCEKGKRIPPRKMEFFFHKPKSEGETNLI